MKKTATLFALFIFLNPTFIFSQAKRANHWYFGMYTGLDFTNGPPVPDMNGKINTAEGCASISDTSGNLLFYTDGITVFNRLHDTMPNGIDLMGHISSTQSALIVPRPGDPDFYYIFTTDADGGANGFRYSIVDLTLDNGNGDVAVKNSLLKNSPTEKICGVGNPTGTGYWIVTHDWGTNGFYAYYLSNSGLNTTPVISNVGTVHSTTPNPPSVNGFQNTYGQMKISPNGQKIAVGIGYQDIYELFDFNNTTGVVSNPVVISNTPGPHANGVEFSRDNSKLYTTRYDHLNDLFYLDQYDLYAGSDSLIAASRFTVATTEGMRQLQLGPDGKIYVAKFNTPFLSVINKPDEAGAACSYQDNGILLDSTFGGLNLSGLGLPGFVASFFYQLPKPNAAFTNGDTAICPGSCVSFADLSLNSPTSWQWQFQGGTPATSTAQNPQSICYDQEGSYNVTLIVGNANGYDTTTVTGYVQVRQAPPVSISVNGDTMTAYNAVSYQWYRNGNLIPNATNGQYIAGDVSGSYTVVVTDVHGCTATSNPVVLTGVNEIENAHQLKIYPVPANHQILFALPATAAQNFTATIVNVLGETVMQTKLANNPIAMLDVNNLPKGYYQLRLNSGDNIWSSGFMKQ